jgi:AcrR family transcriptional regulator
MRVNEQDRTVTGAARRAQIVAATIEAIAELGYRQASFARIAERAGLSSTRLISYHFDSKDELIRAVVADVYTRIGGFMAQRMAGCPDARTALRTYITSLVEFIAANRAPMQALASIFLEHRFEGGERSYDSSDERDVLGHIEAILRGGQQGGEFRAFDTFIMAAAVQRSIDGLPFLLQTRPDLDLELCAQELATLFDHATRAEA